METLIEPVLESNNKDIKIKLALGMDGSYNSNENFKYLLQKKRIRSAIKVRKNSIISYKNNNVRNKEKSSFKPETFSNGRRKESMMEAERWIAKETVFLSLKRIFGEYVCICIYNKISKYDKRDDFKSVIVIIYLEEWYKPYRNKL